MVLQPDTDYRLITLQASLLLIEHRRIRKANEG